MAIYERSFQGDFNDVLAFCERTIQQGSTSITVEGASDWQQGNTQVAVRVYERYSFMGGNRASLSLTLASDGADLFVSIIASGGSQAVLFKVNTFGEHAFLDTIAGPLDNYINQL